MIREEIMNEIINFSKQKRTLPKYFIQDFLKTYKDLDSVYDSLLELLKKNDIESIEYSLNFITYLINNTSEIPGKKDNILLKIIEENYDIFEVINEYLTSSNFFIRQMIIENMHLFKYEDCLDFLLDSIDYFIKNDPINIPLILKSIIKMSDDEPWDLISKIVNHNSYIVRWSFLYVLREYTLDFKKTFTNLEVLLNDEKEFISVEANYFYKKLKTEENNNSLNYIDDNDNLVSYDEEPPKTNFEDMYINFLDIINKKGLSNYSIKELESFVDFYIKNKESLSDGFINDKKNNV